MERKNKIVLIIAALVVVLAVGAFFVLQMGRGGEKEPVGISDGGNRGAAMTAQQESAPGGAVVPQTPPQTEAGTSPSAVTAVPSQGAVTTPAQTPASGGIKSTTTPSGSSASSKQNAAVAPAATNTKQPASDSGKTNKEKAKTGTENTSSGKSASSSSSASQPKKETVKQEAAQKKDPTVTLLIDCSTILNNINKLTAGKEKLVGDGVIMKKQTVTFKDGETVFDVLTRETKKSGIHMEFSNSPIYKSAYIEGINNLYEFDCGELSGWMYNVNGWYPNYGCSVYKLKDGDAIEWRYTCDLGRDLGAEGAVQS